MPYRPAARSRGRRQDESLEAFLTQRAGDTEFRGTVAG
jgi:hypothetical protein